MSSKEMAPLPLTRAAIQVYDADPTEEHAKQVGSLFAQQGRFYELDNLTNENLIRLK